MTDLREIRDRYRNDLPRYEQLAKHVEEQVLGACAKAGIYVRTESRAKEPGSLLKKVLSEGYGYDAIVDKAGARATVRDAAQRELVGDIASKIFEVRRRIDKDTDLSPSDREVELFGYRGLHLRCTLRGDDVRSDLQGLMFELQVRTMGSSLWSDISHDLTYKAPEGGVPREVDRAILRLAAVLELVDQEAERVKNVVASAIDADQNAVHTAIEKQFLQLAAHDYDRGLTAALLPQLMWLQGTDHVDAFIAKLNEFVVHCSEGLSDVLEHYKEVDTYPVLHQPEGILILYAREKCPMMLRDNWPSLLPESELESFEAIWVPKRSV